MRPLIDESPDRSISRLRRLGGLSGWVSACFILAACNVTSAPTADAREVSVTNPGNTTGSPPAPNMLAHVTPSAAPATAGVIIQAGDSIGAGMGAIGNWAAIDHLGLPKGIAIHNVSENGKWMLTGLGQRDTELYPFYDKRYASVLVIQQGTNDLSGGKSGEYQYYSILKPFVTLSQAAGFYVAVDTILPRSDPGWVSDSSNEQHRLAYNKLVRANSIGADAVIDIAADQQIGDTVNPAISLMYFDGLHLRKEGQQRLAKIEAKPLAKLLRYPRRLPTENTVAH